MIVKFSMLVIFFAVMLYIGFLCRKSTTDVGGFVLGGRNVGPWLTAFAYGTSYFSAVVFIGYAGQFGWKYGIAATWAGIGNALLGSFLAWKLLGRRTRVMTQHMNSATMPQFFGTRFAAPKLKTASSLLIFVFLIPYTASLYNGLSRLFGMAFDIDYSVCVVAMAVLTGIYVIVGGYMATAVNDFIQGIIMLFGIVAVIFAVLKGEGGFVEAFQSLSRVQDPLVSDTPGVFASFLGPDPVGLLSVVLLTSLGTWGLPQMVQKFYAIKNEKAISKGTVISTLFAAVVAGGCYFLGGFARLFSDRLTIVNGVPEGGYDTIIPTMLQPLPDILMAVVVILVLSASMSTLSSLVLTSSSTLTLDLVCDVFAKKMGEKKKIFTMRFFVVVFIIISAVIAIVQHNSSVTFIAQLMGISWGALAGAFLAPFLYGLYWKKTTALSVLSNFAFSTLVMVLSMIKPEILPALIRSPIQAGAFCMIAGLVVVPLVSLVTKAPEKEYIDSIFSCYQRKVTVVVTDSIGEES